MHRQRDIKGIASIALILVLQLIANVLLQIKISAVHSMISYTNQFQLLLIRSIFITVLLFQTITAIISARKLNNGDRQSIFYLPVLMLCAHCALGLGQMILFASLDIESLLLTLYPLMLYYLSMTPIGLVFAAIIFVLNKSRKNQRLFANILIVLLPILAGVVALLPLYNLCDDINIPFDRSFAFFFLAGMILWGISGVIIVNSMETDNENSSVGENIYFVPPNSQEQDYDIHHYD